MPLPVAHVAVTVAVRTGQALYARIKSTDPEQLLPAGRRLSSAIAGVARASAVARKGGQPGVLRAALVELASAINAARLVLTKAAPDHARTEGRDVQP